jgi:iron complex outermembrane receptor protein
LAVLATSAWAQDQRVEITGSMLRKTDAETALPVTVIQAEELKKLGIVTAEQALSRIAANQSNFGVSQGVGATTGGKAEADLRGLSGPQGTNSNKTLVLLNGRRIANHAFDAAAVDLYAIPIAAISRIEVLRDGASAIYGTDAIGGVINFILKTDYTGLEISAETQQPQASGGGDTNRVTLSGGFGNLNTDKFNFVGSLDFRKQDVLLAADREFSKSGVIRGAVTAGTSGTSFPGDLNGFEPTLPGCAPPNSIPNETGTSCRYDFSRDVDAIPENEQTTALLRGSYAFTPTTIGSLEYLYARNKSKQQVAAVPTSMLMPATSPFFPAGAPLTAGGIPDLNNPGGPNIPGGVANWRMVPGGKRVSGSDTTTERAMAELQGSFTGGWDYKTALGYSNNKSDASAIGGYLNEDIIQTGVFNGLINPFGGQTAAGQALIDSAQPGGAVTLTGKSEMTFADFRVSKDLYQMPAGMLSGAFGVEVRNEKASFVATDITAALPSLGIDPDSDTSGKRDVWAVFAEVGIPVMKGLDFTVAARYDNYSDFGSTFNPKVGLRFQPMKEMLVRGSYNKGFRAPTLYELYQPPALTFTTDNYDDPLLCPGGVPVPGASAGVVCGQQVLQRQAGPGGLGQPVSNLKPEKSDTYTIGLVFEPIANLSFGIDYWNIKIKEQIAPTPEQAIFGDTATYASRFVRCSALPATGPGASRDDINTCLNFPAFDPIAFIDTPNENLGDLRTDGIDVSAGWRSPTTPYGGFGVTFDGTYVIGYEYQRLRNGEFINAVGRYSDNAPVFRWQHVLTGSWGMGPWSALLAYRYKTGYLDQDGVNDVGSYTIWDTAVTWTGVKNLTLTAGVKNIFDKDPPLTGQVTTFQRGYDPRFTDPLGRTFTFRASYQFF